MRYTASQFKNELDVLEIRLETIGDQFDKIVIAEATVDQRGRPRDLVLPKHFGRFAKWKDKLEYVIVEDMPKGDSHEDDVARERHQRDALIRGMPDLQPDDLVYISDLDEIPYPDSLEKAFELVRKTGHGIRLPMDLFVYALNWRWLDRGCRVGSLGGVLWGNDILETSVCWAILWDSRVEGLGGVHGWHLTYQGGVDSILSKITGMMDKHTDLVMPGIEPDSILTREWVQESIDTGRDIFGRTYRPSDWVDLDQLPPIVKQHPERYSHMLVERPANQDEVESRPRCNCGGVFDMHKNVQHYSYCNKAVLPQAMIIAGDNRSRPRSLDV